MSVTMAIGVEFAHFMSYHLACYPNPNHNPYPDPNSNPSHNLDSNHNPNSIPNPNPKL